MDNLCPNGNFFKQKVYLGPETDTITHTQGQKHTQIVSNLQDPCSIGPTDHLHFLPDEPLVYF